MSLVPIVVEQTSRGTIIRYFFPVVEGKDHLSW